MGSFDECSLMQSVMRDNRAEKVEDLSAHINVQRSVAFIGSGLSQRAFGTWADVVNSVCKRCGVGVGVDESTDPKDLLKAADRARKANDREYHAFLGRHFGRSHLTNPLYDVLMRIPFKSYLTLNFDPLLALETRKAEHNCNGVMKYPQLDRAKIERRAVYYLHGLIEEGETPEWGSIVFTASDFDEAYKDNGPLLTFLIDTLAYDEVLFVGCGLREHPWQKVFDICKRRQEEILKRAGGTFPRRVILRPNVDLVVPEIDGPSREEAEGQRREREEAEGAFYDDYGIRVVRYPQLDEDHRGLRRLFEPLAGLRKLTVDFGFGDRGT